MRQCFGNIGKTRLFRKNPFGQKFQNVWCKIKWNSLSRNVHFENSTSRGFPFLRNIGNSGNFLCYLTFHFGDKLGFSFLRCQGAQAKMAEPAVFYQYGACCFEFTSDDVWQYFFKHVCVDDKGNVLPPLGKWEKRMNAEKTVPIITGISEIFAQNYGSRPYFAFS